MVIRRLEKGECQEHKRCRVAVLIECDWCQAEFIDHSRGRPPRMYCSRDCTTDGNYAAAARAKEARDSFVRTKYGRAFGKPAGSGK
jgi:hypothetical protein